jgi:uncharacterized membrane protein
MPVRRLSAELQARLPQIWGPAPARLLKLVLRLAGWRLRAAAASLRWLSWRMAGAAVLLAGVVHICATFAAPLLSTRHAYQILSEKLPPNRMVVLPLQAPGRQILPYLSPDMLYAMCRYDLSGGPVAVAASVLDAGWVLSLHTPQESNFYVLPGQSQRRTDVSFLLVPTAPDTGTVAPRVSSADTQIASPTLEGLIVLRAPLRGLAWAAETEAALQRAACTPVSAEQ